MEDKIQEFEVSSATVELASFTANGHTPPTAWPTNVSASSGDSIFAFGGVCPFAVNEGVKVYLDVSLKRFDTVFPACGSSNSAIELTICYHS